MRIKKKYLGYDTYFIYLFLKYKMTREKVLKSCLYFIILKIKSGDLELLSVKCFLLPHYLIKT